MSTLRVIAAASALVAATLLPSEGMAQPRPRAAITSMTLMTSGAVRPSLKSVYRVLARGLARSGIDVLSAAQVERGLGAHERLLGCQLPSCLKRIGALLGAPLCVHAKLWGDQSKLRMDVIVTGTSDGKRLAHVGRQCSGCSTAKVVAALGRLATEAGQRAVRTLRARVRASGRPRVGHGKDRGKAYWLTGVALIGAGVAATVVGATLWALDGSDRAGRDPSTERRQVLESEAGGAAATALGVASALTGVGLLVYGLLLRKRSRPRVGVVVDPRRGRALLTGRFEF